MANSLLRSDKLGVALCDLAMMSLAIAVNLLPVFLTTLSKEFGGEAGLSEEQLGRIGAVTFAGLVLGIVVTGPAADRLGGRLFAVAGNFLIAAGLTLLGFADGYSGVLLASFVMGLGAGTLDMILSPIVAALRPNTKTVSLNLLHSFFCIGAVCTIFLGALALRLDVHWKHVALGMLPMPLLIGMAFLIVAIPPLVHEDNERTPIRSLLGNRLFLVLCVAIFLGGSTEIGMAYWLPAYAEKTLGFSQWTAGMAFVGFSLAMAVGRIGILLVPKRFGPIEIMLVCCVASILLFPLASFAPSNAMALVCCVLAGLAGSCLWPSTLAMASDRFPHGGATMFGLLAGLGSMGGICMPWIVGAVADVSNLRWGLATATLCPLLMLVCLLWMRKQPTAARSSL